MTGNKTRQWRIRKIRKRLKTTLAWGCAFGMPSLASAQIEMPNPATKDGAQVVSPAPAPAQMRRTTAVIALPLMLDGQQLLDVTAELALDNVVAISPASLADALGNIINPDTQGALRALLDGLVPVNQLSALGLDLQLDPQTLTLVIRLAAGTRSGQVFAGINPLQYAGMKRISPSNFAFGLTGALLASTDLSSQKINNTSLGLSGFINIGGLRGLNLVSSGTAQISGMSRAFNRDRIIGFIDRPERGLRFSAGDLVPLQSRLSGQFDMLGISFERNFNELQPLRNIRPLGNRSFQLERRSTVEVYINGALVQSFVAEPGPISLRDIPTANLNNNVSIVVRDSLGRREIDNFTLGNDITLLGAGIDEFSFAGGVLRNRFASNSFSYSGDAVGSAFYARGITERTTLSGSLVVSHIVQNTGASIAQAILGGVGLMEINGSNVRGLGNGAAVGVSYRGDPFGMAQSRNANINLRLFYQTQSFRNRNDYDLATSVKMDAAVDYSFKVTDRLSANFGANYNKQYGSDRAAWALFAGGQRNIGRFSLSVSGRYVSRVDGRTDIGAFLALSRPLGRNLSATSTVDTTTGRGRFELRKTRTLNLPEIEYAINAQYGPDDRQLGGNFSYATSRFESELTVDKQFSAQGSNQSIGLLRLQSGIAFVDGQFGIGRDTGNGFVMVAYHESLKDAQIEVTEGAAGRKLGVANGLGPAVIPVQSAYRPFLLHMNGIDLPEGYDIGAGDYVALPGPRSGIRIEVGSAAFYSIIATLKTSEGRLVSLISGRLRAKKTGKVQGFFTNRAGRAVFSMLAPDHYTIEIEGIDESYSFDVADDTETLRNLGTVNLRIKP